MPANYVLLERIELNASAASVTFSNIPQSGYTDLKIVASARATNTNVHYNQHLLTINGSTSSFSGKRLWGDGSSPASYPTTRNSGLFNSNASTANTFANTEIYFTNYLSSNNKSFLVETAEENNATASYVEMIAGLWSNTAAINSITLTPEISGDYMQYSTFSLYGLAAVGTTPAIAPKASGGNIQTDGTYWYHTFLSTGAFVPATGFSCDVLVVAGGGGAGRYGGGGAGGYRTTVGGSALSVTAQNYTVTVGAGGAKNYENTRGNSGTSSVFSTITSAGGGGGGSVGASVGTGISGGSGGGGGSDGNFDGGAGNTPSTSPSQGNNGGSGTANHPAYSGGGGGGATAVGGSASGFAGGNGGAGSNALSSWASATSSGASGYYAGGGGGVGYNYPSAGGAGVGGAGGGGTASNIGDGSGTPNAGTANTGGGGGGGFRTDGTGTNAGGSGIVIIRYAV
jgi:hypothetical protein